MYPYVCITYTYIHTHMHIGAQSTERIKNRHFHLKKFLLLQKFNKTQGKYLILGNVNSFTITDSPKYLQRNAKAIR
jgi:hypothetical protein